MIDNFTDLFGQYPKHAQTPGLPGTSLTKNQGDILMHGEYCSMVGKILYFVKKVSPNCANASRELSQHLENPGTDHWKAIERLLGYLHEDPSRRTMKLQKPTELRVMDVVDSTFANDVNTHKSKSAYLGTIGGTALVNWISKGQNIVTLSSTKSEYVSLSDGAKETTFAMNLLAEIAEVKLPSYICKDNTGAIFLSKNEQVGARTKHIDVRHHLIHEKVTSGDILVKYLNTCLNPSDLLSKNTAQKSYDAHAKDICNGTMNRWKREDVKI